MSKLSDAGKPGERAPEGTHNAMCVGFIDLGTQDPPENSKFPDPQPQRKCTIEFALEVTGKCQRSDGKPFIIGHRMTYSPSSKSNLMKVLRKWLGVKTANYEMQDMIGKLAVVTTEHSGDKYTNIIDVSRAPEKLKIKLPKVATRALFLDENFDEDVFESLSDNVKEKIMLSPEYDKLHSKRKKPVKKGKK